ncbi:hypothetical protein ASPBRDRAFT_55700 [Aspergillus brasiliensis CBS 101740]|uniref:Uncharacterized protein n=1 Tax=Aspergillus brasiliensis (strain CBS 101740 / IMI 381727 / IBT 21946) TaxID=767769 RepID=A0A1L9UHD3_ASPBC|nr:hypothetical protein ASPBRDRAFT_55700 [Aspergillus brasiliensis CBS 101740]
MTYPDMLYPSKEKLMDAASRLIGVLRTLNAQHSLHVTHVGITGGLAVMHHCPDRLPSIAYTRAEDIDVVFNSKYASPERLVDAILGRYWRHFVKHHQTLYMLIQGRKVKIDLKLVPRNRILEGMQPLSIVDTTNLPFINKTDLMTSKLYETDPIPLSFTWEEPETARAIHHGTDALRLALLFDSGKRITLTMRQAKRVIKGSSSLEKYTSIPHDRWFQMFLVHVEFYDRPNEIWTLEDALLLTDLGDPRRESIFPWDYY